MENLKRFYIDGAWCMPASTETMPVENPATEDTVGHVALGNKTDVDKAVAAARRAFEDYRNTAVSDRVALLNEILKGMQARRTDLIEAIMAEMGSPRKFAEEAQVASGLAHVEAMLSILPEFAFSEDRGTSRVVKESIGVCGLITPWNWPLNQIACKVVPALAAGCTMILKPSEIAPLSAVCLAEILDDAGVPPGVFNMVQGTGSEVGQALSTHPDIDMMSFTGSTRAGIAIAKAGADTVKRIHQELGGNAPNILMPDADLELAVADGVEWCFSNSGQSCDAPARLLLPAEHMAAAIAIARKKAESLTTGLPDASGTDLGPVISLTHFEKIQRLIRVGLEEGAELVCGGPGRPAGVTKGYFVRPTVFGNMHPGMTVVRSEIFGPVISLIGYESVDQAVEIANDTEYGLAAYVQGRDLGQARGVAARLRAGTVMINGPDADYTVPFGGYKQSGNGREYGAYGLDDYLEYKAIVGYRV